MVRNEYTIGYVTSSFLPTYGGMEIHVLKLAQQINFFGYKVKIFTTTIGNERTGWGEWEGIDVFRNPSWMKVFREILASNLQLIHGHGSRDVFVTLAMIFLHCRRLPIVFTPHCFYPPKNFVSLMKRLAFDSTIGRISFKLIDRMVNLTEVDLNDAIQLGMCKDRCTIIPNAVDFKPLHNTTGDAEWLKSMGLEKYILYVGRLDRVKNVEFLLQAFSRLGDTNLQLLLIGKADGEKYQKSLESMAKKLDISDRVIFAGRVSFEQLVVAYKNGFLFVLPFPLVQ